MIIKNFTADDFLSLFVVYHIFKFHIGIFEAGFLIVAEAHKDILIHFFCPLELLMLPVATGIIEEPLTVQTVAYSLIKFDF